MLVRVVARFEEAAQDRGEHGVVVHASPPAVGVFAARRSEFTRSGVIAYAATATVIGLIIVAIEIAVFH